jgi:hypothetical protein
VLAKPESYVRVFVDEGAPIAALLKDLIQAHRYRLHDQQPAGLLRYARRLLTEFHQPNSSDKPSSTVVLKCCAAVRHDHLVKSSLRDRRLAKELAQIDIVARSVVPTELTGSDLQRIVLAQDAPQIVQFAAQIGERLPITRLGPELPRDRRRSCGRPVRAISAPSKASVRDDPLRIRPVAPSSTDCAPSDRMINIETPPCRQRSRAESFRGWAKMSGAT